MPGLVVVLARFAAVIAAAVLTLAWLEWRWGVLTAFSREEADAPDLAIARVTVMALVLWETRLPQILAFAHLSPALLVPPRGWSHLAGLVPLEPRVVVIAYASLIVTALLGLIGWNGRLMCGLTAILVFYLQTIPQLFGKVNHTANHLVLFSILLAAAPCSDALALDAIRSGGARPRAAARRAYSLALRTMMLLIGLAYFFPGAWKVARAGTRWFTSDNMAWLILTKLQETPMDASQRWVLGRPHLLWWMAAGTIVFELGFVFVILSPRLSLGAAVAGVAFHILTALVMGISFVALQWTYVVFIPWTRLYHGIQRVHNPGEADVAAGARVPTPPGLRAAAAILLSASLLVGGAHIVGTWPLACYPTFDLPAVPTVDKLTVSGVDRSGAPRAWTLSFDPLMGQRYGTDRWRGLTATFMKEGTPLDPRRAQALLDAWQAVHTTPPLRTAVFAADTYALRADGEPGTALRRRVVGAWTAGPGS
jgi:hypothetical protein